MALLDQVSYPATDVQEMTRGNVGTLLDIEALGPAPGLNGSKINEEFRGNVGTLTDIAANDRKIEERPGAGSGGETSHVFIG